MVSISFLLDRSVWLRGASDNVLDTGVPEGTHKRRRIAARVMEGVARAAGTGELGRSGSKVMQSLWKQRKGICQREENANRFQLLRMARYFEAAQRTFRQPSTEVWSVAWDATRAGGKDLLFSCLWNRVRELQPGYHHTQHP